MEAVYVGNVGKNRLYYVLDAGSLDDALLLSPNRDIKRTSFHSYISSTPNINIVDNNKLTQFIWHGLDSEKSQLWRDVIIAKTVKMPEDYRAGASLVTEFPNKRQEQLKKFDTAAAEFQIRQRLGIEIKAIGGRIGRGSLRNIRRATGGVRGFVRDAVFDPRAIDADEDGWVQEGTQFARRAVRNVEQDVTRMGRGFASGVTKWGRSGNGSLDEQMLAFTHPSGAKNLLLQLDAVRDAVDDEFNNGKKIVTVGDGRKVLENLFPNFDGLLFDELGIGTTTQVDPTSEISSSDSAALYAVLNAIRLNPNLKNYSIHIKSHKYALKSQDNYVIDNLQDGTSAFVGISPREKVSFGRVIRRKSGKDRLILGYHDIHSQDMSDAKQTFAEVASQILKGEEIPTTFEDGKLFLTKVGKLPHDMAEKNVFTLMQLLDQPLEEIAKLFNIELDANDQDNAIEQIVDAFANVYQQTILYHESFHMLHNAALIEHSRKLISSKISTPEPFDELPQYIESHLIDDVDDRSLRRAIGFHRHMQAGESLNRGLMAAFSMFISPIIQKNSKILNDADFIRKRIDDLRLRKSEQTTDNLTKLADIIGKTLGQRKRDLFKEENPPSLELMESVVDKYLFSIEDKAIQELDAIVQHLTDKKNILKDRNGKHFRLTKEMLDFLNHPALANTLYSKLKTSEVYTPKVGDPITPIELISIFSPNLAGRSGGQTVKATFITGLQLDTIRGPWGVQGYITEQDANGNLLMLLDPEYIQSIYEHGLPDVNRNLAPDLKVPSHKDFKTLIEALDVMNDAVSNAADQTYPFTKIEDISLGDQTPKFGDPTLDSDPSLAGVVKKVIDLFYDEKPVNKSDPEIRAFFGKLLGLLPMSEAVLTNRAISVIRGMEIDSIEFGFMRPVSAMDDLTGKEKSLILNVVNKLNGGKYRNYAMRRYPVTELTRFSHILGSDIMEFIAELGAAHVSGAIFGYTGTRYTPTKLTDEEKAAVYKLFDFVAPGVKPNFILPS